MLGVIHRTYMIRCEQGLICPGEILLLRDWVSSHDDATVLTTIRQMTELSAHPYLEFTHCGGLGDFDSVEAFLAAAKTHEIKSASLARKRDLTADRRREFQSRRKELELALIHRDGYVCSVPGCGCTTGLTIDHIVPISKGGTDELSNLRFLCRPHNSSKSDHDIEHRRSQRLLLIEIAADL